MKSQNLNQAFEKASNGHMKSCAKGKIKAELKEQKDLTQDLKDKVAEEAPSTLLTKITSMLWGGK